MYNLSAADFADTGQWRLLLIIGYTGLEAYLENTIHPELEPQLICTADWDYNTDQLKNNIEEAVYKNPRLLDDFATRVILYDPRTLFVPTEIISNITEGLDSIFNKIYSANEADIMEESDGDLTALWAFAPGLKSFLQRTFPGARITSNLMEKIRELRKGSETLRLSAYARRREVDIILLDGKNLISASTQEWTGVDDIAYFMLNLLDIYGYKIEETNITLDGVAATTAAWGQIMNKALSFFNTNIENENNKW